MIPPHAYDSSAKEASDTVLHEVSRPTTRNQTNKCCSPTAKLHDQSWSVSSYEKIIEQTYGKVEYDGM